MRFGWLIAALVACGSREAPPSGSSGSARVASPSDSAPAPVVAASDAATAGLPATPMPVTLPTVAAKHVRVVDAAASFVTIDKAGEVHFGAIGSGYAGSAAPPQLGPALDEIGKVAPDARGAPNSDGSEGAPRPGPMGGLKIRGRLSTDPIDTIVLADEGVDAGRVTDTIARFTHSRHVGIGVASSTALSRYELVFQSQPPPKRGSLAGGPAFIIAARGPTWWTNQSDGRTENHESAWSDPSAFVAWLKSASSLTGTYIVIEKTARLTDLVQALTLLADLGATEVELGRDYQVDEFGGVIISHRGPVGLDITVSTKIDADRLAVRRELKRRNWSLWACFDGGVDKTAVAAVLAARFVVHDGAATNVTTKGLAEASNECVAGLLRAVKVAPLSTTADITVDVKMKFSRAYD